MIMEWEGCCLPVENLEAGADDQLCPDSCVGAV